MNTKEAIQAMLDGKKVYRDVWREGDYFLFDGIRFLDDKGTIVMADFIGDDWEIYEEPKPKQTVTIEKWLCKSAWDNYFIIEGEKAFFKTGGYDRQQVKLLDTYEVEL